MELHTWPKRAPPLVQRRAPTRLTCLQPRTGVVDLPLLLVLSGGGAREEEEKQQRSHLRFLPPDKSGTLVAGLPPRLERSPPWLQTSICSPMHREREGAAPSPDPADQARPSPGAERVKSGTPSLQAGGAGAAGVNARESEWLTLLKN